MKTISELFTASVNEFQAIGDDIFAFQNDNWFNYYSKYARLYFKIDFSILIARFLSQISNSNAGNRR